MHAEFTNKPAVSSWIGLVFWVVLSFTAAGIGSRFSPGDWYTHLAKPAAAAPKPAAQKVTLAADAPVLNSKLGLGLMIVNGSSISPYREHWLQNEILE